MQDQVVNNNFSPQSDFQQSLTLVQIHMLLIASTSYSNTQSDIFQLTVIQKRVHPFNQSILNPLQQMNS